MGIYSAKIPQGFAEASGEIYHVSQWETEHTVLYLNKLFTTGGLHILEIQDFSQARLLVFRHIRALGCFYNPYYIDGQSMILAQLDAQFLLADGAVNHEALDHYFIEFFHDFLCIELTEALVQARWFYDFYALLISYKIFKNIPVILLSSTPRLFQP